MISWQDWIPAFAGMTRLVLTEKSSKSLPFDLSLDLN
jgi:hypothetical protein